MHPKTIWSLCAALVVALVAGALLLPGPAAQARQQRFFVITPSIPPTATATTVTDTPVVPTNTNTPPVGPTNTNTPPVGPTNTATTPPVEPTNTATTPIGPTGTASSPDSTATPRPTRAPAPGSPSLHISKSSSSSEGLPGDFVTFTLKASNDGSSAAQNVTISDSLPDFLEIYNVKTTKGVASNKGQTVTVRLDSLEPGETVEVTILAKIRDDATPQSGSNIGVIQQPGEQQITSERVPISVLPKPVAAVTPVPSPAALPVTNGAGGDLQALMLLFAVGVLIVSIGWAVLGVRRR